MTPEELSAEITARSAFVAPLREEISRVLIGQSHLDERMLAWTYPHNHGSGHRPSHAIRRGTWKLIHFDSTGTNELYNLDTDLGETSNLAEKHPDKVKKLHTELQHWILKTTP